MKYGYEDLEKRSGVAYKMIVNSVQETPYHWHKEMEILFVVKGTVTVTVDGQKNVMEEDDVMIINSNKLHSTVLGYTSSTVVLGVQVDPDYYDRFLLNFSKRYYLCKSFLHSKSFDIKANPIRGAIAKMFLQYAGGSAGQALNCLAISNMLCSYIYHNIPWEELKPQTVSMGGEERIRINDILEYIRDHAENKMTLDEIAYKYHMNKFYLSHFFKEKVGMGLKKYIFNVRLDRAAEQLLTTNHNVTYIANECGFSNQTSFFTLFKQRYGCLPAEFRQIHTSVGDINKGYTELDCVIDQKLKGYLGLKYASLDYLLSYEEKQQTFVSLMHRND